jgi:PleD family two-component response regulator
VQRLTKVLRTLRAHEFRAVDGSIFRITFSAGVAEYPADGQDLQTLYRAADTVLFQAKEEGRDRVLPVGWQSTQTRTVQRVDVVVVDDDEALAGLLLHTLETRGYRTHWLKDGRTAVETLAGQHPTLKAQAVLLDVDLPGLDGFSVLRGFAQDGILQDTRTIMLTVRTTEAEELKALELGAFDYVAKPFSPPVLMQRIRRALRS